MPVTPQSRRSAGRYAARVVLPGLIGLCLLGACSSDQLPSAPQQAVVSHFVADTGDTIETIVIDPLPVRSASLKLPDGRIVDSDRIDRDRQTYSDDSGRLPNFGVGVAGGSSSRVSSGFGFGFPLFGGGGGTRTSSMTTSTIRFRVPDMNLYRAGWQGWILHLDLDDGINRRVIETLPPAPPK